LVQLPNQLSVCLPKFNSLHIYRYKRVPQQLNNLTLESLKDELIRQPFFLLRSELNVWQSRIFVVQAAGRAGMSSARANLGPGGQVGLRAQEVGRRTGLERLIGVLHDVEEGRRVAEDLVVVEARLVLEEAENLLPVVVGVVVAWKAEAELALAVREAVVDDAVEERFAPAHLLLLQQLLLITGVVR